MYKKSLIPSNNKQTTVFLSINSQIVFILYKIGILSFYAKSDKIYIFYTMCNYRFLYL